MSVDGDLLRLSELWLFNYTKAIFVGLTYYLVSTGLNGAVIDDKGRCFWI